MKKTTRKPGREDNGNATSGSNRRSVPLSSDNDYLGTSRWGNPSNGTRRNEGFIGVWTNSAAVGGGGSSGSNGRDDAADIQQTQTPEWENHRKLNQLEIACDSAAPVMTSSKQPAYNDENISTTNTTGRMFSANVGSPGVPSVENSSAQQTKTNIGTVSSSQQQHLDILQQLNKIQLSQVPSSALPLLPRTDMGVLHTNGSLMNVSNASSIGGAMPSATTSQSFMNNFSFPSDNNNNNAMGAAAFMGSGLNVPGISHRWQPPFGAGGQPMGVSPSANTQHAFDLFSQINVETAKLQAAAAAAAAGNFHQQQQQQQHQPSVTMIGGGGHPANLSMPPSLMSQQQHQSMNSAGAPPQMQLSHMQPPGTSLIGGGMPPGSVPQHLSNMQQPPPPPQFSQQMFLNQLHQQLEAAVASQMREKLQQQQQQANEELRKQQQELQHQRQLDEDKRRASEEAAAAALAAADMAKLKQQEEEAALNREDDAYDVELRNLHWDDMFQSLKTPSGQLSDYSAYRKRVNDLQELFHSALRKMTTTPSRNELKNLIALTRFTLEAGEQCFLRDAVRSYADCLHDTVWKNGLHALFSFLRREHDVVENIHERRGLVSAITSIIDFGINFFEQLVSRILGLFGGCVDALALQLAATLTNSQQVVLKLGAHLGIALGDLYRYKGLQAITAISNFTKSKDAVFNDNDEKVQQRKCYAFRQARRCYENAYNLSAVEGYAQNQLALTSRLERCYLDMVYHCVRALSVPKSFALAQQMLQVTLEEVRIAYEHSLDEKFSSKDIEELDLATLLQECVVLFLYFHSLIADSVETSSKITTNDVAGKTSRGAAASAANALRDSSSIHTQGSQMAVRESAASIDRQQQVFQQVIFDLLTRWKAILAHGIREPVRNIFLKMNVINMHVLSGVIGNPIVFPPVIDLCLHMFATLIERLLDVLTEAAATPASSSGAVTPGANVSSGVEYQLETVIMDEQVSLLMSCCKAFCDWLVTHIPAWNPLPATPFLQSAVWTYEKMLTLLAELCTVSRQINLQGVSELVPYRTERFVPFQLVEDTFGRCMTSIREAHVIFHNEPSLTREVAEMRARMSRFMLLGNMFATMQNPVFEFDVQTLDLRPVAKYIDKSLEGKYRCLRLVQPAYALHLPVTGPAAAAALSGLGVYNTPGGGNSTGATPLQQAPNPAITNFFNAVLPPLPPQALALSSLSAARGGSFDAAGLPSHSASLHANDNVSNNFGAPRWNTTTHRNGAFGRGILGDHPPPPPAAAEKAEDWPDLMDADTNLQQTPVANNSASMPFVRHKDDGVGSQGVSNSSSHHYVHRGNAQDENHDGYDRNSPSPLLTPGLRDSSASSAIPPATTSTTSTTTVSSMKSSIDQPWWLIDKNMRREALGKQRDTSMMKRDMFVNRSTKSEQHDSDSSSLSSGAKNSALTNQRKYLFVDTNCLLKGGGDCVKKLMTEESRLAVLIPSVVVRELTNHTKDLSRSHEEQSDAHAALDFVFELSSKRDARVKIISIGGLLLPNSAAAMKENAWERGSNDDLILKCVKNAVEKGFIANELKNSSTSSTLSTGGVANSHSSGRAPFVAFLTEDTNLRTKARREQIEALTLQDVIDAKFKWVHSK